jgi:hypothetical protein
MTIKDSELIGKRIDNLRSGAMKVTGGRFKVNGTFFSLFLTFKKQTAHCKLTYFYFLKADFYL